MAKKWFQIIILYVKYMDLWPNYKCASFNVVLGMVVVHKILEYWKSEVDNRKVFEALFADLSNAFDFYRMN